MVSCFVLLVVAKYSYPRRFANFITLPLNDKFLSVRGKEDAVYHPFNLLFFTIQVISVSILIFLLFRTYNPLEVQRNQWLFVQIITCYFIFICIKYTIEKIIANVFSIDLLMDHYLYHKLTYRNYVGLFVFVGDLLFLYVFNATSTSLLIFTIGILLLNAIALFFVYKKNGKIIVSHFLHFILYLCALEISPYIILYKLFFSGDNI